MPTMTDPTTTAARVTQRGDGEAIDFLGCLVTIKVAGEDVGDRFSVAEHWCPAGFGPPPHVHHEEDETFVILEGAVTGVCGGRPFRAEAGATVFLPRGVPHAFTVAGERPARMMVVATPAGFERFCRDAGAPASRVDELPAPPSPADVTRMLATAPRFGIEILPPE